GSGTVVASVLPSSESGLDGRERRCPVRTNGPSSRAVVVHRRTGDLAHPRREASQLRDSAGFPPDFAAPTVRTETLLHRANIFPVTGRHAFGELGYHVEEGLFDAAEIEILCNAAEDVAAAVKAR